MIAGVIRPKRRINSKAKDRRNGCRTSARPVLRASGTCRPRSRARVPSKSPIPARTYQSRATSNDRAFPNGIVRACDRVLGCGQFEKLADHRQIRIHRFEAGRQRIFQRNVILQLSRVHPVGDENLIAQFEWRHGRRRCVSDRSGFAPRVRLEIRDRRDRCRPHRSNTQPAAENSAHLCSNPSRQGRRRSCDRPTPPIGHSSKQDLVVRVRQAPGILRADHRFELEQQPKIFLRRKRGG